MDDEHEDDDGIDAARSGCRNEDSGDGTRGIQVADSGEIGRGTPDGGVEQGQPDSSRVDGTGEGVQQVALQWRSAPLPTVDEFAGYERIQPGAANRIITMAEKSLDAEIERKVFHMETIVTWFNIACAVVSIITIFINLWLNS